MSELTVHRRSLITGLVSFIAAPAIVRASSLMPVKQMQVLFSARIVLATGAKPIESMRFCADGTVLIRDYFTGKMVPI
jgi:hypothetical protein